VTDTAAPNARPRLRLAVQLLGFLIGLALLGWCAQLALSPDNRAQLVRLGDAGPWPVLALVALSALSLILNGLAFWAAVFPVHRLRALDVIAVNAMASFLAFLPFKIGLLFRVFIHGQRDGVPLLTIGAWFAAVALVLLVALLPLIAVSLWRPGLDAAWFIAGAAGIAVCAAALVLLSRVFAGERGLTRIHAVADRLPIAGRLTRTPAFGHVHHGFTMTGDARGVAGGIAFRVADALVQSARLWIAADVLGVELTLASAVVLALGYFVVGMLSPFGMLGTREAGAAGIALALGVGGEAFAPTALLVGAVDAVTALAGAAVGAVWLRPDRLLRSRRPVQDAPADAQDGA